MPLVAPVSPLCAVLITGAGKDSIGVAEAFLGQLCGPAFDRGWRTVFPPLGGASIASGYTPAALAGTKPRHPLPPRGENRE